MKALALFDFDGTLYLKDSFSHFILYTLDTTHVVKQGVSILPWINAYYLGVYPAAKMRKRLFYKMFHEKPSLNVHVNAIGYTEHLLQAMNPTLFSQMKQHQVLGHDVVLVSASLNIYLAPLCERLGIALICSEVEEKDGRFTGYYQTLDCSGMEKKRRVMQNYDINQYKHIYAYGNTVEDVEMLSLATHPFMCGRDTKLPKLSIERERVK